MHVTFLIGALLLTCGVFQNLWALCAAHSTSQTTIVKHTKSVDPAADGFWKRNTSWKSRWVKYWRPKAIYVPIWKKVWTPVVHTEWVPLPKAPPGWALKKKSKHSSDWSTGSYGGVESGSDSIGANRPSRKHIQEVHL